MTPAGAETRWRRVGGAVSMSAGRDGVEEVVPVDVTTWVLSFGVTVGR
ncbi:hypothetical protein J2S41_002061 [Catenuloplanes atrovinosus]|uniref:Uncharacterized protein n=1 Tax=Catenuloplanes atrovinosus TaxID=137266 RepID=A0AAE3YN77_9ACTN|nr:hypothetical protein [Catenuloplanes atrovinosus]